MIHDLSRAGCSLEYVERPRIDESIWIKFDGVEALESIVRWIDGDRAGVQFVKPLHEAVFDSLIARLS
jgi:hypothetical protein